MTSSGRLQGDAPSRSARLPGARRSRPDRMAKLLTPQLSCWRAKQEHIWWGTSVENRKHGVPRITLVQITCGSL